MPSYTLHGVEVEFPFNAYPCQLDYMGKVIESLKGRKNALLESPTGTGKTLCLLCATLGWRCNMEKTLQASFKDAKVPMTQGAMRPPMMKQPPQQQHQQHMNQGQGNPSQPDGAPAAANVKHMLPTIIYSSRTHSQLIQVMRELKRTSYKVAGTVVASRNQLCLHPTVNKMSSGAANTACRTFVAGGQCEWHRRMAGKERSNTSMFLERNPHIAEAVLDIEELGKLGRSKHVCPYFLARDISSNADIVFMPYNYLLDARNRQGLNDSVKWNGAVLIFDEAHNVESVCADSASIEISGVQVGQALTEVNRAKEYCRKKIAAEGSSAALSGVLTNGEPVLYKDLSDKFTTFANVLKHMEDNMASWALTLPPQGKTSPGVELYAWLQSFKINEDTLPLLHKVMEEVLSVLNEEEAGDGFSSASSKNPGAGLQAINDLLSVAMNAKNPMRPGGPPAHKGYRLHMRMERPDGGGTMVRGKANKEPVPKLSYWCFIPGIAMAALQAMDIHCMILTSGTLAPLDSFAHELQVPFPVRLENPHVIQPSQIWVGVMSNGPTGHSLCSSYQARSDPRYKTDLGLTIINVARATPDGLLVFFPSYVVLESCLEHWKNDGEIGGTIWDRICRYKQPVVEPRDTRLFAGVFKEFMDKLNEPLSTGAVFFAVCRGKVSEGLDFSDRAARAVVITGIPFANRTDPKVMIKQQVLDEDHRTASSNPVPGATALTGDQWYVQQATRAVNQAIGRVIRHINDFGAVVLADSRFANTGNKNNLSKWLRDHVQVYPQFGPAASAFTKFFKGKEDLIQAARDKALAAALVPSGPVFQVTGSSRAPTNKSGVRNFLDKSLVPAAMDVSGLPSVPRGLAAAIGSKSNTNSLLSLLNDAAKPGQVAGSTANTTAAPGSSSGEPVRFAGKLKEAQMQAGSHQNSGNDSSKDLMANILGGLDGPARKRQRMDTVLGGRTMQPIAAPAARKPFVPTGHDTDTAAPTSNVIGPAHLVREHQQRMAQQQQQQGQPTPQPQQTHGPTAAQQAPPASKLITDTSALKHASIPGTAANSTISHSSMGRMPAPAGGSLVDNGSQREQRDAAGGDNGNSRPVGNGATGGPAGNGSNGVPAGGAVSSSVTADPKQFLANIGKELSAAQLAEFKQLLKRYRESKDQEQFIEGIVSLFKGPATAHLLPHFAPQFRKDLRDWFQKLIQPYVDDAMRARNQGTTQEHPGTAQTSSAPSSSAPPSTRPQVSRPTVTGQPNGGVIGAVPGVPAGGIGVKKSESGKSTRGESERASDPGLRQGRHESLQKKESELPPRGVGHVVGQSSKLNGQTNLAHKPVVPSARQATLKSSAASSSLGAKSLQSGRDVAGGSNQHTSGGRAEGSGTSGGQCAENKQAGRTSNGDRAVMGGSSTAGAVKGATTRTGSAGRDGTDRQQGGDEGTSAKAVAKAPSEAGVKVVAKSGDTSCVVCKKPKCEPNAWKAKCGHVACYPCWLARLKSRPSCPGCNQRTSRSELVMVPFV